MELLLAWGLEEEVLAGGNDADVWLRECQTLAEAASGPTTRSAIPAAQSRWSARRRRPPSPGQLEPVLRQHLRSLPTCAARSVSS